MTLGRIERGKPLASATRSMTGMMAVERACDDGRAGIAALRAQHASGTGSAWLSPSIEARVAMHFDSLDALFTALRQSAGDLGTDDAQRFREVLSILGMLTSDRLAGPAEEVRMRENHASAQVLAWLRRTLDPQVTDVAWWRS